MKPVLLIDFGSTYTKVTAVDVDGPALLGTAASYTTVETDVGNGLQNALTALEETTGPLQYEKRLACSSAAGGLRMIACGLVPSLTAEAARLACLGAGAKVIKSYSYGLTDEDVAEIDSLKPDIFLLAGGIDGGNARNIIANAGMLAGCTARFPILLAGNRNAAAECEGLLAGHEVIRCPNVMPRLDALNIEPIQEQIRALFLQRIIHAKGLSEQSGLVDGILMPTPSAMLGAMKLLADGTEGERGIGELMAIDLGGATTDVYSIATGAPQNDSTIIKGLPEPYAKRTVEGDIGMRYSAMGVLEAVGTARLSQLSGLGGGQVESLLEQISTQPDTLPHTPELAALDFALAAAAVQTAAARHAGTIEEVYTPMGLAYGQTGKDLRTVRHLVVTGGAIIHNPDAAKIAAFGEYSALEPQSLRPTKATVYIDRKYILAAMGLLAQEWPAAALTIMKKELEAHGTAQ